MSSNDAIKSLTKLGGTEDTGKAATRTRAGKSGIITWQLPAVRKQLKMLSIETDKSQQELFAEALNMLFAHYGKPQIAAP
jgi:ribosomal protein L16/L10AE